MNVLLQDVNEKLAEPDNLYARACVLMDGGTGRILFGKNQDERLPMASTTKIMTLIVALENCNPEDVVTVSAYAAGQPKVHLGTQKGQQFVLKDLFYSLMLESHNDSAVMIAEHIGGKKLNMLPAEERTEEESKQAVKEFTDMMNEKARDIGCFDTYFITPNGLDASVVLDNQEQRIHSTTAKDLAQMLSYCITMSVEREEFLSITRMPSYRFSDVNGQCTYSCNNHNAFLAMMDGALTGKTGFTNDAGYCYVGALERDGKLLIVSLLGCGWPNHRTYKWKDTKKLMEYGLNNFEYQQVFELKKQWKRIPVENAMADMGQQAYIIPEMEEQELSVLMAKSENIQVHYELPDSLAAPIGKGDEIGSATYSIDDKILAVYPIYAQNGIKKRNYVEYLVMVLKMFIEKV